MGLGGGCGVGFGLGYGVGIGWGSKLIDEQVFPAKLENGNGGPGGGLHAAQDAMRHIKN